MKTIRIATRKSPLAIWQAEFVKSQIEYYFKDIEVILIPFVTKGDIILDTPLAKVGGKGLFVKELELALLANDADIAVHSMKDVPADFPDGLKLGCICKRENPQDAFVSNQYNYWDELPEKAIVGTSSLRRQAQIRALRPDLIIKDLRGNVGTRLSKLDAGEYDAIILAAAGLIRLGLSERISSLLPINDCLPAVGQGAVGVECRADDSITQAILSMINHTETSMIVSAERAFNHFLQGGCQVPIAGHAILVGDNIHLDGLVASLDGKEILRDSVIGPKEDDVHLGQLLAKKLIERGAKTILSQVGIN